MIDIWNGIKISFLQVWKEKEERAFLAFYGYGCFSVYFFGVLFLQVQLNCPKDPGKKFYWRNWISPAFVLNWFFYYLVQMIQIYIDTIKYFDLSFAWNITMCHYNLTLSSDIIIWHYQLTLSTDIIIWHYHLTL